MPQECRGPGKTRTVDLHAGDPNSELAVVSIDTTPGPASQMYEATLNHFGYEHYLLGSTKEKPQPPSNGVFRLAFWHYRYQRYLETVQQIAKTNPRKIIILSDANDVLFAAPPAELIQKFKQTGKEIILTGHMSCCNVRLYEYVREEAKSLHFEESDLFSTDPKIKDSIGLLQFLLAVQGRKYGDSDGPLYLWTPAAQREMKLIKAIPMVTKYRYVNAGGVMGYANSLAKAMTELNMQPFDDDEEQWTLWYAGANGGYHSQRALLDYQRDMFALVDDFVEGETDKLRVLFDDQPELPTGKFFNFTLDAQKNRWKTEFGTYPVIFHCAGCNVSSEKMRIFHERILRVMDAQSFLSPALFQYVGKC